MRIDRRRIAKLNPWPYKAIIPDYMWHNRAQTIMTPPYIIGIRRMHEEIEATTPSTEKELSYAATYYRKNREKLLAARRARYASDPDYRKKEVDRNAEHYRTDAKYRQRQSFQKHLHTRERNDALPSRLYRRWYYVERHKTGETWLGYKKRMIRLILIETEMIKTELVDPNQS